MSVSAHIRKRLADLLEEKRIVVWYDGEGALREVLSGFAPPGCRVVQAAPSPLRARREAEAIACRINDSRHAAEKGCNLLVYVPWERGQTEEAQIQHPFEGLALQGVAFGDKDGEKLHSLARQAMPDRIPEIDRLFREGRPTVALLDELETGARYPLLRQAVGTESPIEVAAQLLCRDGTAKKLAAVKGATEELLRLLNTDLGFTPPPATRGLEGVVKALGIYVLLSEFAFDLPGELPETLASVPRAEAVHRERIYALCDRMRGADDTREGYVLLATEVERLLRLRDATANVTRYGSRDTFPFQEEAYLHRLELLAAEDDLVQARAVVQERRRSLWRHQPERALRWKVAERCVDFLDAVTAWGKRGPGAEPSIKDWILAYVATNGLWRVDREQRLVEQGAAACVEDEEIAGLVALCRHRYREVAEAAQRRFLRAVGQEGWPPEGISRQTQAFDRHMAPALAEGRRVALFLVDSMRYKMGRDLAGALDEQGTTSVAVATAVLPGITQLGMAALMPGADGAFTLVAQGENLLPAVGGRPLADSADRMALLRERYGDRFAELTLGDLLSASQKKLAGALGKAGLVVVRTQDLDAHGEGVSLYQARKMMTDVLGELVDATRRLVGLGFQLCVYAADHGHVLSPEVPPGDVLPDPPGSWKLAKRRCRLGESAGSAPGTAVLKADRMGIIGPVRDLVVAEGFKVFTAGEGYFHEGISLQECLIPVVSLLAQPRSAMARAGESVEIRYRSDRFTSRIIGLKVHMASLITPHLTIRLEAYGGSGPKARLVAEAADCDARDPVTGLITLKRGEEAQVPLQVREDFTGEAIEVRAIDPTGPGVILHRLRLKNGILD